MSQYFSHLKASLEEHGYRHDIYIMTSNGGVSTVERAKQLPIATVLSGPAGGVAAAVYLGKKYDLPNLITCDMGGTSTDVCLVEDLRIPVTNEQSIAGHANRTPQIGINAVGAGGGSIAWLDAGEILNVGPQSAGADPGPACYDRGGLEPTVTDANLILNRLHQENPLAGRISLSRELAMKAIQRLGERISSLDEFELAEGIIQIAVARMVSAIKQISMASGYDPRDFTLVAYGGAGPMHAVAIAEELEMQQILVPLSPGNLAAFGSLISDLKRDHVQTKNLQLSDVGWDSIETMFQKMEGKALSELRREGIADHSVVIHRSVGMRYVGQSWELNVDIDNNVDSLSAIGAAFANAHERRFGHRSKGATEIVNFRIAATAVGEKPDLPLWNRNGTLKDAQSETRQIFFNRAFVDVAIYQRQLLPHGSQANGPCIIEESGSTTVLPANWYFLVLEDGSLLLNSSRPNNT
jgi:N-methylhydantoinase A